MERPCLKTFKGKAEETRRLLLEAGMLDAGFMIRTEGRCVLLPVKDGVTDESVKDLLGKGRLERHDLVEIKKVPRSYKDIVEVPEGLRPLLPTSFDMVGDVLIIKLPDEVLGYKEEIGRAVLEANRHVMSVALDRGVKGALRVRDLVPIAGRTDLETVHIENNLRFKLDPSKVYFSPRLSTERLRIASLVEDGESVLDMFCGVGPFALTIARHSAPEHVLGIDLNPECIRYFKLNAALNSLSDKAEAVLGDAREIVPSLDGFDRVIMNLPHNSVDFLEEAFSVVKECGHIHLYRVVEGRTYVEDISRIMEAASRSGRRCGISQTKEVHQYSPVQHMMAFDIDLLERSGPDLPVVDGDA